MRNRTAEAAVDSSDGSFRTSSLCPRISTEAPKQNSRKRASSFLQRHPPLAIIDERQCATGLFQYLKRAADASRTRNGQFRLHRFREIPLAKTGLRIKGLRTSSMLSMLSSELWTRLFELEKKVALESKSNILRLPPVRM